MNLRVPSFPAPGSMQTAGGVRNKVVLKPGHSLMDWIRLGQNKKDLAGTGGRMMEVTPEELARHNTVHDAWIALKGKVYNVTPYMDFHPGGVDELIRGAGKDATQLFEEIHKWVNAESMLEKCLVGKLKMDGFKIPNRTGSLSGLKKSPNKANSLSHNGVSKQSPSPPVFRTPSGPAQPRYEWLQSDTSVTIVVYTKWKGMIHENVIIDREGTDMRVTVYIENMTFEVHLDLENEVTSDYEVKVLRPSGKVEIILPKVDKEKRWSDIGQALPGNGTFSKTADRDIVYRDCKVLSVEPVTHDCKLFGLALPEGTRMCIPTGHHIHIRKNISGVEVVHSYTVVPPSLIPEKQDQRQMKGQVIYLMIKIYPDGTLTPHIGGLAIGDTLSISNHTGTFREQLLIDYTDLVMLAAGTGFTPMARLIWNTVVQDTQTKIRSTKLMFFNKTKKDILWEEELNTLADTHDSFVVKYVLSEPREEWTGLTGRIRKSLMEEFIPTSGKESKVMICVCGPNAFTDEVVRLAEELGHPKHDVHAFQG